MWCEVLIDMSEFREIYTNRNNYLITMSIQMKKIFL